MILRRLKDTQLMSNDEFQNYYSQEVARFQAVRNRNGGDFYKTQLARVSRQFVSALVESTLEGRTPYREALRLLNISKVETFHKIAEQLTVSV